MSQENEYVQALENLIMDTLMPMYLVGCKTAGINPKANEIVSKLLAAKKLRKQSCYLLEKKEL